MAEIQPFRGIRYTSVDVSRLIAPPYDILDEADKARLLAADDHNVVAIDLPHVPPKTAGPDNIYRQAAGEMTSWMDIHAIERDELPAIYVYHQTYRLGRKTLTRKMFFARLRLEEFGKGCVFAHEQTFGGPKEDRLKLTVATRCNLSPIFGLYPDAQNEVAAMLERAVGETPEQVGRLDGVENKLWVVTDPEVVEAVRATMKEKSVFIADGHHRYGTALMFRQQEVDQMGHVADIDPVNFVLCVLCAMEDPGATIQPYFRSICDLPQVFAKDYQQALVDKFTWKPVAKPAGDEDLAKMLREAGPQALALYDPRQDVCAVLSPKDADLLAAYEPNRQVAWRQSAYSIFHRYILDEVVSPKFCVGKPPTIHYHKTMDEAINDAREHHGVAALMPATTMKQLRDICTAGELMPQKSTYFAPKLATGMVMNPLY